MNRRFRRSSMPSRYSSRRERAAPSGAFVLSSLTLLTWGPLAGPHFSCPVGAADFLVWRLVSGQAESTPSRICQTPHPLMVRRSAAFLRPSLEPRTTVLQEPCTRDCAVLRGSAAETQ